ncbi:MAG TPA: hypothetical protein ENJ09_07495 [Planctomycetes bacterium]|nr:hypothetical protein [Planctomycetota bacterium]
MSSAKTRVLGPVHYFFLLAVFVGGAFFCFKVYEFLSTIRRDDIAGFAFDPVVIYGFVAMGFGCLLYWAFLSGQFKDVEQPKLDMLDNFAKYEAHDVAILEKKPR